MNFVGEISILRSPVEYFPALFFHLQFFLVSSLSNQEIKVSFIYEAKCVWDTHVCVNIYIQTDRYAYTCKCTYTYTHMHKYMHVCVCICIACKPCSNFSFPVGIPLSLVSKDRQHEPRWLEHLNQLANVRRHPQLGSGSRSVL